MVNDEHILNYTDLVNNYISLNDWRIKENSRQHALQTGVCPMCEDCPDGCPVETPKDSRNIVTNADRIRSMNDEELARFLGDEPPYLSTYDKYLEWLRQPAKEEHNETDRR
jgi:formate hydrogenlyase subunit 6/NADH:ubiquinone oxidoreductase subunit I